MVASLDGFIAKKNGDISWMQSIDHFENGITLTEERIADVLNSIDCYVMGSHTYEHALELGWPYEDVPVIVLTHRNLVSEKESVEFFSGDLTNLVNDQLKPKYTNIWMVGGAETTKEFLQLQLADELIISFIPILLGDGLLFFDYIGKEQKLHLKDVETKYYWVSIELKQFDGASVPIVFLISEIDS